MLLTFSSIFGLILVGLTLISFNDFHLLFSCKKITERFSLRKPLGYKIYVFLLLRHKLQLDCHTHTVCQAFKHTKRWIAVSVFKF